MYAYRSFRVGTIISGLLAIFLIIAAFKTPNAGPAKIQVENPIEIKGFDSLHRDLKRSSLLDPNQVTLTDSGASKK